MGDLYDAPNQQVVRADGSAPWDEGTGGNGEPEPEPQQQQAEAEPQEAEKPAKRSQKSKDG